MFKVFVILMLLGVVASLFSGLYYMFRNVSQDDATPVDPGRNRRMARALTVRIALSMVLFAILILGYHWGWYSQGTR